MSLLTVGSEDASRDRNQSALIVCERRLCNCNCVLRAAFNTHFIWRAALDGCLLLGNPLRDVSDLLWLLFICLVRKSCPITDQYTRRPSAMTHHHLCLRRHFEVECGFKIWSAQALDVTPLQVLKLQLHFWHRTWMFFFNSVCSLQRHLLLLFTFTNTEALEKQ